MAKNQYSTTPAYIHGFISKLREVRQYETRVGGVFFLKV